MKGYQNQNRSMLHKLHVVYIDYTVKLIETLFVDIKQHLLINHGYNVELVGLP